MQVGVLLPVFRREPDPMTVQREEACRPSRLQLCLLPKARWQRLQLDVLVEGCCQQGHDHVPTVGVGHVVVYRAGHDVALTYYEVISTRTPRECVHQE